MSDIKFYVPKGETIPTNLSLYVGDEYVTYERIEGGFRFLVYLDDEDRAMKVVEKIVRVMIQEHDESEHGVSWRTVSLKVVPQEDRYKIGTMIDWVYRVRDSY